MKQRNRIFAVLSVCFSSYVVLLLTVFYSIVSSAQLQDPTRPPDYQSVATQNKVPVSNGWILSSILISPERRVAIINGTAVQVGDMVGDIRVISIDTAEVLIQQGNKQIALTLIPETFRTRIEKRPAKSVGGRAQ